ncbi:MAG: hypothetical protein GTN38_02195 [Candidatus Aenigmarchaeota archaeon]|nr:hypothetical protein [Candidatus Aenigmarchaeota archaeon]NIP40365.1 hypothetical protein [Candidatus Aenigmarchaeota archaeon]NIQ18291.1 hypothetical protein [Candidatus Aenigmarchaeota archaeon]NIS73243.1 hypothetical protein [Candidatus Aenigmarchaeota archaeon]
MEGKDPFESARKSLKEAIDALNGKKPKGSRITHKKGWAERFVKRGLKRGHFWIWRENREVLNDKNFVKVNGFESPRAKLGFRIRSNKIKIKKFRKTLKNPIGFHEENFDEWVLKRCVKGKVKEGEKVKRHHLVGDYDTNQKKWTDRFVKGGLKRGHLWIWKENREVLDNKNFVEVEDYEDEGKVGFNIRSKNVELKWHWKSLKEPIKFHKESLEEWLLKKTIQHGEKLMEKVG